MNGNPLPQDQAFRKGLEAAQTVIIEQINLIAMLRKSIRILLRSHNCWSETTWEPEIEEEISGQFDVTLEQAKMIREAVLPLPSSNDEGEAGD